MDPAHLPHPLGGVHPSPEQARRNVICLGDSLVRRTVRRVEPVVASTKSC